MLPIRLPAAPFGPAVRTELAPSPVTGVSDPRDFNQTTVTPHFGPDMVHSWSLGVQRQISSATAVEARYVGNHGGNLFQSINANPFIADTAAVFPNALPANVTPCTTAASKHSKCFRTRELRRGHCSQTDQYRVFLLQRAASSVPRNESLQTAHYDRQLYLEQDHR